MRRLACLVGMTAIIALAGCSDDDDGNGGGGGADAGTDAGIQTDGGGDAGITPGAGLRFEIQSATAGAAPTVTFKATNELGEPIDLLAEIQANTLAPRFTLAQLTATGYQNLYEIDVTGKPFLFENPPGTTNTQQPAVATAKQVRSDPPSGGTYPVDRLAAAGNGVYTFTFGAPIIASDATKSHRVGIYARRGASTGPRNPAAATFDFLPSGGTATSRQSVTDAACAACHPPVISFHDQRQTVGLCLSCHTSQLIDPESGNSTDMKVMVHKIHRGANLPSVINGQPYYFVGFDPTNAATIPATSVENLSDVQFPQPINNCTTCHQGPQADAWKTAPSLAACGSCHDNVSFTDASLTACNDAALPQPTAPCKHSGGVGVTSCTGCHPAASIASAHGQ